jgi:hypothetical protein
MKTTIKHLRNDSSGAVAVEFTVAVLPLFFIFFGFWQVAALYTADLAVRHGANAIVRAAVVIRQPDNPGSFVGSDSDGALGRPFGMFGAFGIATAPWSLNPMLGGSLPSLYLKSLVIDFPDGTPSDTFNSNYNTTHVTIQAVYRCTVPLGKRLACGSFLGNLAGLNTVTITREASLAHQGARYKL